MGRRLDLFTAVALSIFSVSIVLMPNLASAQLRTNYYANTCPNVESIVRNVVNQKFKQTFVTVPAVLRLFFHDCFVEVRNTAEKDHPDNLSLAGDGFDTVIKAKAAIDSNSRCRNKVSCADILALATRDVIQLSGGPWYPVELGRLDGFTSKASNVEGKLPKPTFNLNQLNSMFASHGLTQADMIALSAAHSVGFSHCDKFSNRIYNFSPRNPIDPTLNKQYAAQLQGMCPRNVDPRIAINMDPKTPRTFDNNYFKNLQQGMGLFTSDQVLYTDRRSKGTVDLWASNSKSFQNAFVTAMIKLGRVGVKTGRNGNIRFDCGRLN
ncbi:Peroxidase 51 [Datura stramonium]|uniref:Peroxidase n=1 Tax=Datura stramonium TaxID=4076 RepID=A0ABS8SK96_DATST|nr:Peroxidase 51 [Datura stramonium]